MARPAGSYKRITSPLATAEAIRALLAEGLRRYVVCARLGITENQLRLFLANKIEAYKPQAQSNQQDS